MAEQRLGEFEQRLKARRGGEGRQRFYGITEGTDFKEKVGRGGKEEGRSSTTASPASSGRCGSYAKQRRPPVRRRPSTRPSTTSTSSSLVLSSPITVSRSSRKREDWQEMRESYERTPPASPVPQPAPPPSSDLLATAAEAEASSASASTSASTLSIGYFSK